MNSNNIINAAFWFLCGSGLIWIATSLRLDGHWREFSARLRGSNPPPPARRFNRGGICPNPDTSLMLRREQLLIRSPELIQEHLRRAWSDPRLGAPPPAPGMRREYLWSPSGMAECGGPCWEAQDPRLCHCGALWRDVPIRWDEGQTQRGNGNGGPTTPKPPSKPQPHGGRQLPNLFP